MKKLVLMLALLLGTSQAFAADATLADKLRQYYQRLDSFSADFTQVLSHKESGSSEKRNGKLSFKKPLLIRWQTAKPHEETLVVTDREIWDYLPDEELAYRYSPALAQDSRGIIKVLTGQATLTQDFDVKPGGVEKGLEKLILYPHEPTTQMVEATLWVDPASGQIRRARIMDFYGNANDVTLANFKPDARFPNSEFKFSPPKGTEVEDRIDRQVEERELFK